MSTYTDLSLSFKKHPGTNDVLKKIDVDAVKASMKNIISSTAFDIPFDPNCGSNLRGLLFDNITPSSIAVTKRSLLLSLADYEPRAIIEDLYIGEDGDTGINIGILFHVEGSNSPQTMNFVLERVR